MLYASVGALAFLALVVAAVRAVRRRGLASLRIRAGQCPACGYDRRAIGEQTPCPECGSPPHLSDD